MLSDIARHELIGLRDQLESAAMLIDRSYTPHPETGFRGIMLDKKSKEHIHEHVTGPLFKSLREFAQTHDCGKGFFSLTETLESADYSGADGGTRLLVNLGCAKTAADRLLRDPALAVEAAVEIAFAHLQRLIVVDDALRTRWQAAYAKDEPACEQLGGTHLLHHGLWAFKSHSDSERSDLVLGQHASAIDSRTLQAARGLILTEWKRHTKDSKSLEKHIEDATRQLERYAAGSLAAIDLRSVRYVVVVSEKQLPAREDAVKEKHRIRFLNIAVAPATPSKG